MPCYYEMKLLIEMKRVEILILASFFMMPISNFCRN